MKLNPFFVALNYFLQLLRGKVNITRKAPGNNAYPEGFRPFLFVKRGIPESGLPVRLVVKFKVSKLNLWQRVLLPILSIPFFAGVPGFVDKVFLLNEPENILCGFYTWQSREDAERYIHNYPGKLMAANALPQSLEMIISELNVQ